VRDVAHDCIDPGIPGSPVNHAFGNITPSVDAQPQEDRRAARPLIEEVAGEIAPLEHRRSQPRRLRDATAS
jgi:hypothetical protein